MSIDCPQRHRLSGEYVSVPVLYTIYIHVVRSARRAQIRTYASHCPSPCLTLTLALTFPQSLPYLYIRPHHT